MVRIDSLRKVAAPSLSLLQTDYKVTERTKENDEFFFTAEYAEGAE